MYSLLALIKLKEGVLYFCGCFIGWISIGTILTTTNIERVQNSQNLFCNCIRVTLIPWDVIFFARMYAFDLTSFDRHFNQVSQRELASLLVTIQMAITALGVRLLCQISREGKKRNSWNYNCVNLLGSGLTICVFTLIISNSC